MLSSCVGGNIFFPIERAGDVLSLYGEYGVQAPDELQLDFVMVQPPGDAPGVVGFGVCYSGPEGDAERALAPVYGLGTPIVDTMQAMDYVALQKSGDIDDPRARASYLKSGFFSEIPPGLIAAIVDGMEGHPSRATLVIVQQSGGAIGRVSNTATAFAQRAAIGNLLLAVDWAHDDDGSEHTAWIKQFWTTLEPFTHGFYVNDGDPEAYESAEFVHASHRENYPRLVEIKNRYDPDNLFRMNANVAPTV